MNRIEAIRSAYPATVSTDIDGKPYDKDGNLIIVDESVINAEILRLEQLQVSNQYKSFRKRSYPAITEQLDMLYHLGYDGWKAEIQKVKNKYPKPNNE